MEKWGAPNSAVKAAARSQNFPSRGVEEAEGGGSSCHTPFTCSVHVKILLILFVVLFSDDRQKNRVFKPKSLGATEHAECDIENCLTTQP